MNLKSSKKVDVNRYELEVEISAEDFNKELSSIYQTNIKKIVVPGFRKGKAPKAFVEKYYGENVFFEDALNNLYPDAIEKAVEEAKLDIVEDKIDLEVEKMSKEDGATGLLNWEILLLSILRASWTVRLLKAVRATTLLLN